jgi:hypothetical protein
VIALAGAVGAIGLLAAGAPGIVGLDHIPIAVENLEFREVP